MLHYIDFALEHLLVCNVTADVWLAHAFTLSTMSVCADTVVADPGGQWSLPAFLSGDQFQLSVCWWSPCTLTVRPPSVDAHPPDTLTIEQTHKYV